MEYRYQVRVELDEDADTDSDHLQVTISDAIYDVLAEMFGGLDLEVSIQVMQEVSNG